MGIASGGKLADLMPGSEVILSENEQGQQNYLASHVIGRRNTTKGKLGNTYLLHSDISIITVLQKDELMHRMLMRLNDIDKKMVDKTMVMAAALMHSTQGRGQYTQPDTTSLNPASKK